MGINAQMFLKYRGDKPTDHQLKLWSWDLCRAVGAKRFFLRPEKGVGALELSRCYENPSLAGKAWEQDGETLEAEDGEWFIEVNLYTRYYGEGYERGDWATIINTAEWLEQNIGGEVWYGGDSSGVCASPFGRNEREAMRRHALSERGKDYYSYFAQGELFPTPAPCSLCVKERGMTRYGWGNNYVAVACGGCGKSFVTHDGGKTWESEDRA